MLLLGGALVVAGVIALAIGLWTRFGLRVGPIPIPLSVVGPLLSVVGIAVGVLSMRQLQCKQCKQALELGTAWFPLEREAEVLAAVQADPGALAEIEMGSGAEASIEVTLEYCEKCRAIADLKVEVTGDEPRMLFDEVIQDARVAPLIDVIVQRDEAHSERYEASNEE